MHLRRKVVPLIVAIVFGGCEAGNAPTDLSSASTPGVQGSQQAGVSATAEGGGQFLVTLGDGFQGEFAFSGVQTSPDGSAEGNFRFSLEFGGELLRFHAKTTCMTVDPANGRAWFGGVITKNESTHPAWMTDVHEPGDAIWFRAVDYGEGSDAASDRTTFVGFEGNADIITSEEYCEEQIWPEGDARTWEVVNGNVQVGP